jgi:hypothetical protein
MAITLSAGAGFINKVDNDYVINDAFDDGLALLSAKQTAGDLWNPSNEEFGDYFRKIQDVTFEIRGNGYAVTNNGSQTIEGFSLLVEKEIGPTVGINYRHHNGNTIMWFDLAQGEYILNL